ncbi:hypothetical protein P8452_47739 [Trifolium repens]|nr:hypothetical protein P8452_47739 [Trifolium repens]
MAESPRKSDSSSPKSDSAAPGNSNSSPRKADSSSTNSNPSSSSGLKGIAIPKKKFDPLDVPRHDYQVDSPLRRMLDQEPPVPPFLSSGKSPEPSPTNSPPRSQQPPSSSSQKQPPRAPPSKQPPCAPLKQPPTALEQSPSATEQQQASSLPLLRNDVVVVGLLTFALGYAVAYFIHGRK